MALVDRAKNMLLTPKTEWDVVSAEATPQKDILLNYVLPLAAVAAIAQFISSSLIGTMMPMVGTFRMPIGWGLAMGVMQFVIGLAMVYVMGFIIDALAPTFGGTKNALQSFKVAAYTYTPVWVASVPAMIPYLGTLFAIAGALYAIYLLYLGLPKLMQSPPDKAVGYTALVVVVGIVVSFILSMVIGLVTAPAMMGAAMMRSSEAPTVTFDKDSKLAKLDDFAKKMEAAGKKMEEAGRKAEASGNPADAAAQMGAAMAALGTAVTGGKAVEPVQLDVLKPLLPETFAGLPKTSQRSDRSGVAGLMAAKVRNEYADAAGKRVTVEVVDTGGAAGLMGIAAWAAAMSTTESEDDNRIERMRRDGNRLVREEISKKGGTNHYSVILADRFIVQADGTGVDINALKSGVSSLDLGRIESLK